MPALSTRYRSALVTGVSGGLGSAFAEMLLSEGVAVWGTARSLEKLANFRGRKGFTAVQFDLSDFDQIERVYRDCEQQAGGTIDLLVNNAGYGVFGAFTETPVSTWEQQVSATLTGTLKLTHLALAPMLRRKHGCIANISSVAVEYPLPFMAGYNVVKAGLSALSESLIFETTGCGVNVIDFRPGDYRTAFNQSMQATSSAVEPKPDQRLARAWEILEANLAAAPEPRRAALDLRRALQRGKSGTVYSGSFFQVKLAPLFSRLAPASMRRAVAARYFGAV